MKPPFSWDSYSDQPHVLRDRALRRQITRSRWADQLLTALESLIILPAAAVAAPWLSPRSPRPLTRDFYALCVNEDKGEAQYALVEELGVRQLQLRIPLWEMERLEEYLKFARGFGPERSWLITVMQDREHVLDRELSVRHLSEIFDAFSPLDAEFMIGNAVNRTKWGFFSMGEYLEWYQAIERYAREKHPGLILVGPGVIDFEYHYLVRALFHRRPLRFDRIGALLYVDRRGSPRSRQMGYFDLSRKIDLLYALARLGPAAATDRIYVTETNWPLSGTAPWAPTGEKECVDEASYTRYMQEYYQIAAASGKVERVYWHQLIAPGYGLVDHREGALRKREAFYRFKEMIRNTPDPHTPQEKKL